MLGTTTKEEFPIAKISAASVRKGMLMASIIHSDELAKLADLKDKGILTEEEFAAQKQKLLSR
jgi:putative oligomerization/nucleic acid binding protein